VSRRAPRCGHEVALRTRIEADPTVAFFVLAFGLSWSLGTPAMIFGLDSLAALPFFVGFSARRRPRSSGA
jgi:hypothetical protein